jgi:L-fuconolactonase
VRIDTHQHYWRFEPASYPWIDDGMAVLRRDRLPADRLPLMRACGVSASLAVQARDELAETEALLAWSESDASVAGVVGWADLREDGLAARLDAWRGRQRLRGFRHLLQDEPRLAQLLDDPSFNRGVAQVQQRGYVYDVLVFDHQLPLVTGFCARHDRHWLVLDHCGKPQLRGWLDDPLIGQRWSACLRQLAALPHLACKLSGLVTETAWRQAPRLSPAHTGIVFECFDRALEVFGPRRLMFGSDWPVCELAAPYETVAGLAQGWAASRLSTDEQRDFWAGTAIRCYGLTLTA